MADEAHSIGPLAQQLTCPQCLAARTDGTVFRPIMGRTGGEQPPCELHSNRWARCGTISSGEAPRTCIPLTQASGMT